MFFAKGCITKRNTPIVILQNQNEVQCTASS